MSDGSAEGTVLVRDVNSKGTSFGSLSRLVALNGLLYFLGEDNNRNGLLWRSGGTPAGTFAVAGIEP